MEKQREQHMEAGRIRMVGARNRSFIDGMPSSRGHKTGTPKGVIILATYCVSFGLYTIQVEATSKCVVWTVSRKHASLRVVFRADASSCGILF